MLFFLQKFCSILFKVFGIIINSALSLIWKKSQKLKDITEDIILITGGGKGIGRHIALHFAHYHPRHIVLWGRTASTLEKTAKEIEEVGVKCTPMICDVALREQIYQCAQDIQDKIGDVSILVNNAGVVYGKSIIDSSHELIENTFKVNILSHFWALKAFLPSMICNKSGHIVEISSVLGLVGLRGAGDYCSSKFAVTGLTESLYDELNITPDNNIKLTSIYPYIVANEMFAGIQTRLSWLIPPLSEDYVAKRTVEGVLANRNKIILPRIMYLIIFLTSMVPMEVQQLLLKVTGADKAMSGFHGNQATAF